MDPSWVTSINWALIKNFTFGKDFIFTYGALGFLSTRTDLGFSAYYFLLFDLFILGNFAFIFWYVFHKYYNLLTIGLSLLIAFTLSSIGMYYEQIVLVLLLISIFWLIFSIKTSRTIGLIIPVIITALLFYIKVNISFVALIIFYLYLFYFLIADKKNILVKILYGLALPTIIFALSFPLNTDLAGCVLGSLALINGYNDAMNTRLPEYANYSNYAIAIILIFFITLFIRWRKLKESFILFLTCGIFTFVLFKQSFVRADLHILNFFALFPGLCGVVLLFYKKINSFQILSLTIICIICLIIGLKFDAYPNIADKTNYFSDILTGAREHHKRYENNFRRFTLPDEVKNIIGNQTVDIIPGDVNFLYFNNLNYQPRPVIQSYSAYTPYLIKLNEQRYEDYESAPNYVIYSNSAFDGRYPLFDDMNVKFSLIRHYICLGLYNRQNSQFLIFQRKSGNTTINFSAPVEEIIKFGEDFPIKDINKTYFIKINIKYNLVGKAVRFFFKPFQLSIYFTLADGTTRWHRAIVPILENGVMINPYIENEKDFMNFARDGFSSAETKKIKSFRIELDSVKPNVKAIGSKTYKPEIQLSVSEMSIERNN